MHPGEILAAVVIGFVVFGGVAYFLSIFNGLVALRNQIARAWANIDVVLKQRHDELPKLIATTQGYMQHEREIFDALSAARGALLRAHTVGERAQAENLLTRALGQFFAVAEAYPDLKANASFLQLQSRISELENQIADRRELYNDTVALWNTRLQQIPDAWVAGSQGMTPAEPFHASDEDRRDVEVRFAMAG